MHQLTRLLAVAVTAAACTATLSTPAHAQTREVHDATGDVLSGAADSDTTDTPEPDRTEGDVLSLRVSHRRHVVRLVMQEAGLTRVRGDDLALHVFSLRTDEGRRAELDLVVSADRPQGERVFTLGGRVRPCRGATSTISYAADTVEVAIPRRCLSAPRWVRVGGGTAVLQGDRLHADDASRSGSVGDELTLGRRVRRG